MNIYDLLQHRIFFCLYMFFVINLLLFLLFKVVVVNFRANGSCVISSCLWQYIYGFKNSVFKAFKSFTQYDLTIFTPFPSSFQIHSCFSILPTLCPLKKPSRAICAAQIFLDVLCPTGARLTQQVLHSYRKQVLSFQEANNCRQLHGQTWEYMPTCLLPEDLGLHRHTTATTLTS